MDNIQKLTVYLGSSGRCKPIFKETAETLGQWIGKEGKALVYGGMDAGLMGIVANNALQSGASVTGIIPKSLKDSERIHPDLSQTILVPDLWERKLKMFKRADAVIGLAGGFGTIDEMLEALYWAHLGSHAKPVIFVNTAHYWDDFIAFLETLPDLSRYHFMVVDSIEDLFTQLDKWQPPEVTNDPEDLPHFEDFILQDTDEPLIFDTPSVKDGYVLATALGLKQLGRHDRHIGILNTDGQFDLLLNWIASAQTEKFITDHCTELFSVDSDRHALMQKLDAQKKISIDLHHDKWGPSETKTHIEIRETE
tara:strand:+ start:35566 stop:36492 length:927 start_codon:yes stop_codon:yes gene_type:complete